MNKERLGGGKRSMEEPAAAGSAKGAIRSQTTPGAARRKQGEAGGAKEGHEKSGRASRN